MANSADHDYTAQGIRCWYVYLVSENIGPFRYKEKISIILRFINECQYFA